MRNHRRFIVPMLLAGCDEEGSSAAAEACASTWPTEGEVAENAPAAAAECEAEGGEGCDASGFLSEEAALCIAEAEGLEAGIRDWWTGLTWHHTHGTVVWNVTQTAEDDGSGGYRGQAVTLDATTGAVLAWSEWDAQP